MSYRGWLWSDHILDAMREAHFGNLLLVDWVKDDFEVKGPEDWLYRA